MSHSNYALSLDIETLGLGPDAPIIQVGAYFFDINGEPGFDGSGTEFLVKHCKYHNVEPYAAHMNADLMLRLANNEEPIVWQDRVAQHLAGWLGETMHMVGLIEEPHVKGSGTPGIFKIVGKQPEKIVVCGKNAAGFDLPMLKKLPYWNKWMPAFHHRVLDPAMLYWNPDEDGSCPPNLETCLERAGYPGDVSHTALDDAKQTAKLIQKYTRNRAEAREIFFPTVTNEELAS